MSPGSEAMRRPGRCPACKSTFVHRQAGWHHKSSTWYYCYSCHHAWRSHLGETRGNPDGELTGHVSVVASRKRRHALGSVVVQVISYKLTGKRVFRMAPIHHHYEQLGWTEPTIVIRFWIVAVVLALLGLATLKLR